MGKLTIRGYAALLPAIDRRECDGYRITSADGSVAVGYDEYDEFTLTEPGFAATVATKRDAARALKFYSEHEGAPTLLAQVQGALK